MAPNQMDPENNPAPLPVQPVSPSLGAAISGLSGAANALNSDPNGENQDEYNDFLAIDVLISQAQVLATKYMRLGR
jgi:hypothetical protein